MSFPSLAFKIAADMIQQRLEAPALAMPQQQRNPNPMPAGQSALRFIADKNSNTATEPAPKVVTDTGRRKT